MRRAKWSQIATGDDAGSALLELGLCLSTVMLVLVGIMEVSLGVYTEHYVEAAAASGARYATVRGSTYKGASCTSTTTNYCEATSTDIQTYIRATVGPAITSTNVTVTATWPGTNGAGSACYNVSGNDSPGCLVTVTVTYPFTLTLPGLTNKPITLKSTRSTVISQ